MVTCTLLNNPIAHQYFETALSSSGDSTLQDCRDSALFDACCSARSAGRASPARQCRPASPPPTSRSSCSYQQDLTFAASPPQPEKAASLRRHDAFQLLEPVLHKNHLRRAGFSTGVALSVIRNFEPSSDTS